MPPVKATSPDLIDDRFLKSDYILNLLADDELAGKIFSSANHATSLLKNLNILRQSNRFCDVEIVAGKKVFKAHRSILSASSPYFHAMFSNGLMEAQKDRIILHAIDENVLEIIMDFIYTGNVSLNQSNVQNIIIAADMFELNELVAGCTTFMKQQLHNSNAIGFYRFAKDHNCLDLAKCSENYIEAHFPIISKEEEFLELPKEYLYQFIQSERLQIDSEHQVLTSVMKWILYDLLSRKRYIFEVLSFVRLPLISLKVIDHEIAACDDNSLKLALKSVRLDLATKRGNLVPLRAYPRLCTRKNIYIIGGSKREIISCRSIETILNSVERLDTYKNEWCNDVSPMLIDRLLPGVATLNGKIYVVGGEHDSQIIANGEVYDPDTSRWTPIANLLEPRCEFGLCELEGQLYALGGWVGDDIGETIEKYDANLDTWQYEGDLPTPRFSMGVVSYDGRIYIVGGCTRAKRHLRDLICWDPITNEWRTLAPMIESRSQIGVAILDHHLYVVGGINKDSMVLRSVERYSFAENQWTLVGNLKIGRASPAVAAASGCLYVMGGDQTREINFYRSQVSLSSVEKYDPVKGCWEESLALPQSRSEAAAIVL